MFSPRQVIFSKLFYCSGRRQQKLWKKVVFLGFREKVAVFWRGFGTFSEAAGDFFEAVLLQQPQATEAVEKGCFSRISEETLGSFLAWFWN